MGIIEGFAKCGDVLLLQNKLFLVIKQQGKLCIRELAKNTKERQQKPFYRKNERW